MNHNDITTYGKTPLLAKIFKRKGKFIQLPADVDLTGLDNGLDEE